MNTNMNDLPSGEVGCLYFSTTPYGTGFRGINMRKLLCLIRSTFWKAHKDLEHPEACYYKILYYWWYLLSELFGGSKITSIFPQTRDMFHFSTTHDNRCSNQKPCMAVNQKLYKEALYNCFFCRNMSESWVSKALSEWEMDLLQPATRGQMSDCNRIRTITVCLFNHCCWG